MHAQLLQPCSTLCNPMGHSLPGSSVHEIFLARILEWVAMPSSRGSFQPRNQTHISCTAGRFFITEPLGKPSFKHLSLRFTSQGTASPEGSVHRWQIGILQVHEVTHPFIPGHLIKCGSFMNIYALPLNSVSNFIGLLLFICLVSHSTYIYGVLTMCQALTIISLWMNRPVSVHFLFMFSECKHGVYLLVDMVAADWGTMR